MRNVKHKKPANIAGFLCLFAMPFNRILRHIAGMQYRFDTYTPDTFRSFNLAIFEYFYSIMF